jgi:hypothetical protein
MTQQLTTSPENADQQANSVNQGRLVSQADQVKQENRAALRDQANTVPALKNLHEVNQH